MTVASELMTAPGRLAMVISRLVMAPGVLAMTFRMVAGAAGIAVVAAGGRASMGYFAV